MDIQNDLIVDFANFAKSQFEQHKEELIKKYTNDAEEAREALRLKVFNEQLHSLKVVLSNRIEQLTEKVPDALIKKELERQYRQIINAFLKGNFYTD
jgi:hypothetical protein